MKLIFTNWYVLETVLLQTFSFTGVLYVFLQPVWMLMCIVYLQIVLCLPRCGDSILTMLFCIEMFYTSIYILPIPCHSIQQAYFQHRKWTNTCIDLRCEKEKNITCWAFISNENLGINNGKILVWFA